MPQQVPSNQVENAEHQFPPFPPQIRDQIRQIQEAFSDVCPDSVDEWDDGFRRDAHPIREIELWLAMAELYRAFSDQGEGTRERNEDVWRVLLAACATCPEEWRSLACQSSLPS